MYTSTPQWKAKGKAAISRAGGRCQNCGSREALVVHHRTYAHLGDEWPADLEALCVHCHGATHGL